MTSQDNKPSQEPWKTKKESKSVVEQTSQQHKELTLSEVLHLLRNKVIRGHELPESLSGSPWRVPGHDAINGLLSESLTAQSSTVPNSEEFQHYILSNSALCVSGLIQYYLKEAFNVDSEIVFGVLLWDEAARSSSDDYEGTPHLWIHIRGTDIDNASVAVPEENLEYFYKARSASKYAKDENPYTTDYKLYLGQDDEDEAKIATTKHNLKVELPHYLIKIPR